MFGIAALVLLLGSHIEAYRAGGEHARRVVATQEAERAQNALQAVLEAFQKAEVRDKEIKREIAALPGKHTIETIIRENPSTCVVPGPVDSGLRENIRAVNEALSR
jgi:hypothetical protein